MNTKNKKVTNLCLRLGEERKRLSLNQNKVADYLEVSVKTVSRWEKSIPIPADKLSRLVQLGYDISYILTGIKLAPQTAGLDLASNIWNAPGNIETEQQATGSINEEQTKWLNILENLAGGDRKRLELIGLALVGYSQALKDK